jgi:hypothetical protein
MGIIYPEASERINLLSQKAGTSQARKRIAGCFTESGSIGYSIFIERSGMIYNAFPSFTLHAPPVK